MTDRNNSYKNCGATVILMEIEISPKPPACRRGWLSYLPYIPQFLLKHTLKHDLRHIMVFNYYGFLLVIS